MKLKIVKSYYYEQYINLKNKFEEFYLSNSLVDKKLYENILVYNISIKTLVGAKTMCIRFDKIDEFIRIYDGTKYLVLFGGQKYDFICNRIQYFIWIKNGITNVILIIVQKTKLIYTIHYP